MPAPEILAPAGNAEMLRAAVFAGADAVYLGLDGYNARRSAGNFTPQALREAVCFCHARGVAVHVTLNTLVYGDELEGLAGAVRAIAGAGADAVILDDLAAAALVRAIAPDLRLHGSTQMSIHTPEGAKMLAKLGYSRAILARELSLAEIRDIVRQSPIECEVFIHGAMCMSMSGQCMMSAFLGGRSGNRGDCAGPCRLPFDAGGNLRPGQPGTACHLSLKDMDLIPHMAELQAAGVASVKIEGRLRTPEYAAAAVAACRAAREGRPYDEALVRDIFSRSGFSDGYLTGRSGKAMFGVRTEADAAATRAATPKARELFRRELERVPADFSVRFAPQGVSVTVTDPQGRNAVVSSKSAPQPAQKDPLPAMERALAKTGGTPFYANRIQVLPGGEPGFLPGSEWNELRRTALQALLQKRSEPAPVAVHPCSLPRFPERPAGGVPALAARFERADQLPDASLTGQLRCLIVPIREAGAIPPGAAGKSPAGTAPGQFRRPGSGHHPPSGRAEGRRFCRGGGQQPGPPGLRNGAAPVRRAGVEHHQPAGRSGIRPAGAARDVAAPRDAGGRHAGGGAGGPAHSGAVLRASAADAHPCLPAEQRAWLRGMRRGRAAAGPQGSGFPGPVQRAGLCRNAHHLQSDSSLYGRPAGGTAGGSGRGGLHAGTGGARGTGPASDFTKTTI